MGSFDRTSRIETSFITLQLYVSATSKEIKFRCLHATILMLRVLKYCLFSVFLKLNYSKLMLRIIKRHRIKFKMFPKIFQTIKIVINMPRMYMYVYTECISNSVTKQYFCYSLRYDEMFHERIINSNRDIVL